VMPGNTNPNLEPFLLTLHSVVNRRTKELGIPHGDLARKINSHYRSFSYWLDGQRKFPADRLAQLCLALENCDLLDFLEQQVGRVAYTIPTMDKIAKIEDVRAIQSLVKEVGEALESLAQTLEDGIVEKHELEKTVPALDDVIRECARLKHWLQDHYEADHKMKPKSRPGRNS
jgi:hypothetical protein